MVVMGFSTNLKTLAKCTNLIRGTDRNSTTTTDGWVRIPGEVLNKGKCYVKSKWNKIY